jgi:hypothetical protein
LEKEQSGGHLVHNLMTYNEKLQALAKGWGVYLSGTQGLETALYTEFN